MDEAIFALLTSDPAVTALIGDRVFPVKRDQDAALPAITYRIVSAPKKYNSSGPTIGRTYLDIFYYAGSFTELTDLMEKTEAAIDETEGQYASRNFRYTEITDSEAQDFIEKGGIYPGRTELLVFSD